MRRAPRLLWTALLLGACADGTEALTNPDATLVLPPDGAVILPDAGPPPADAGPQAPDATADAGVLDTGGVVDTGVEPGCGPGQPRLGHEPWNVIFHGPEIDKPLTIENAGTGGLRITRLAIAEDVPPETADDFFVVGCASLPCTPDIELCAGESLTLDLRYLNADASGSDFGYLVVDSNDPLEPSRRVELHGLRSGCNFPYAETQVLTSSPAVGLEVVVSGAGTNPGGVYGVPGGIVDWEWAWLDGPAEPPLSGQGTDEVRFVPPVPGTYRLSLRVTNSCGQPGTSPVWVAVEVP